MKHFCAEPVTEHDLVVGQLYYFINFVDPKLTKPVIKTRILEKVDDIQPDSKMYYFADLDRYVPQDNNSTLVLKPRKLKDLKSTYTFEKAIDLLNESYNRLSPK